MSFLKDTFNLTWHEFVLTARNPIWIFFGLFEPVVYLLFFAPFLQGIASSPEFGSNTIQFFAPGLLIMTAMFNAAYVGFALLDKLDSGFIERIRVTPISRAALALGLVLENALVLLIQSAILIGVSHFFFGLSVSIPGSIFLIVLLVLVGIVMSSLSFSLAILIRDGGILANAINFFVLPLFLLSGVMLPISFAPPLIQTISKFNPFSYSVDAARLMLAGRIFNEPVMMAFVIFAIVSFAALRWFMHVTRQAVA